MHKPKKRDGRGRSAGSRANHFSKDNQPDRSAGRRTKVPPEAAEMLHKTVYEKVTVSIRGKKVKIPFIEAFMRSMRKNAMSENLGEQIKYFKELVRLGIFEVEEYKQRIFKRLNNYYKRVVESSLRMADGLDEIKKELERVGPLYHFYFVAYVKSRERCTCGACEKGLEYAEFIIPIILKAVEQSSEDQEADDDEVEEDRENEEPDEPEDLDVPEQLDDEQDASSPDEDDGDDDPDNEFYRGMRWD